MIYFFLLNFALIQPLTTLQDDRVFIQVFLQSLWDPCNQFIVNSAKDAIEMPGFDNIGKFKVWSFGYAKQQKLTNGSYSFTCPHGQQQCLGNMYQTCASTLDLKYYPFIICLAQNQYPKSKGTYKQMQIIFTSAQLCAKNLQIDINLLQKCVTGQQGNELQHQAAVRTSQVSMTSFPFFLVNGESYSMKVFVCTYYQGRNPIPPGCNQ